MLGALEFKHMTQRPMESVRDYIIRLERAFREAYGREPLSRETGDALLYAQLQDCLRYELLSAPAVSGALNYEQLCVAAKGEERRLAALKKQQDMENTKSSNASPKDRAKPARTDNQQVSSACAGITRQQKM